MNPLPEERLYMPAQLDCVELADETTRAFKCALPPGGNLNDFMIVGKQGWLNREAMLIDCQAEIEIRNKTR